MNDYTPGWTVARVRQYAVGKGWTVERIGG